MRWGLELNNYREFQSPRLIFLVYTKLLRTILLEDDVA